jgi:hypothetical protein
MIINLKDSQIFLDDKGLINDLDIIVDHVSRLVRLKFNVAELNKPIDLIFKYSLPKICIPIYSMEIEGQDQISKKYFVGKIEFHFLKSNFYIKGVFGEVKFSQEIKTISDVTSLINSLM